MLEENKNTKITEQEKEDPYLVSPKLFHLEMPLYHKFDLSIQKTRERIFALLQYSGTIDVYCIWCEKESVFKTTERVHDTWDGYGTMTRDQWLIHGNQFTDIKYTCTRKEQHEYHVRYIKRNEYFAKIGQFPSVADFQIPTASKYRKILGEESYKELTRGIGIAANGVGIGAFVYLRRIFERLIEEAHVQVVAEETTFSEEKYKTSKMDEKIKLVAAHLPEFLVENRSLYGILSKGIHELTEKECLKHFDVVKIGIEQILDEKIAQDEKLEKAKKARQAIVNTHGEIAKPK